jgi:uncharacterized protein
MNHFLLLYDVVPDFLDRRPEHRAEHLRRAWQAQERGEMIFDGALEEPTDGVVMVFRGQDSTAAEEFARSDPYVAHGLVTNWRVRKWDLVVGDLSEFGERQQSR